MPEIACPLANAANRACAAPAIIGQYRSYTYHEYHERVSATAHNLRRAGLSGGDLARHRGACVQYPIILLGCMRLGVVACPVNPKTPPSALATQLDWVRCTDLVVPYGELESGELRGLRLLSPMELASDALGVCSEACATAAGQPAVIVFTSGSAGEPKPAMLSFGGLCFNAEASNENMPLGAGDRWLLSLPLYHVSGLGILFRCLLAGAAVVVPEPRQDVAEAIVKYDVTHVSLVAAQLKRLLRDPDAAAALRRLKTILLGGGPIQPALIEHALDAGLPLRTTYGLTEMGSQVTTTREDDPPEKLRTSGKPLRADWLRIAEDGELLVRGESLFLGYVKSRDVSLPLAQDGYFATGDLGHMDEDGYLVVEGRRDNQFVSGGENIQPEEIERHLAALDGIIEAVVVPAEDEEFGHVPVAFLKTWGRVPLDVRTIEARLARALPRFKIPKAFYTWPGQADQWGPKARRKELAKLAEGGELRERSR